MKPGTVKRLGMLEATRTPTRRLVAVYDQNEADELHAVDPGALVVITGVPRAARTWRSNHAQA